MAEDETQRVTAKQLLILMHAMDLAKETGADPLDPEIRRRAIFATELGNREMVSAEFAGKEHAALRTEAGSDGSDEMLVSKLVNQKLKLHLLIRHLNDTAAADSEIHLDGYELERPLGQGGMGIVYLVKSSTTGRRFALKTIRIDSLRDAARVRAFLAELETWIDIPAHPNLVRCYFFRTLGSRIGLFLEYIEGTTLHDEIAAGRLDDRTILDRAIQCALALGAVHELDAVHQDVTPRNILVTTSGTAKLTDFGLATARSMTAAAISPDETTSDLANRCGFTLAYCSPEQDNGERLSLHTDVWSWGLLILTMYTGEVSWISGAFASEVLASHLESARAGKSRMLPGAVQSVLDRCFNPIPEQRWGSMAEAAAPLIDEYRRLTGQEYPHDVAPRPNVVSSGPPVARRQPSWNLAHRWLVWAAVEWSRRVKGTAEARLDAPTMKHFNEAGVVARTSAGSTRAQAIAELAGLEEAQSRLEGPWGSKSRLGDFYMQKALLHERIDDLPGALLLYERAELTYEQLRNGGSSRILGRLAEAALCRGRVLLLSGDPARAHECCHDAVRMLRRARADQGDGAPTAPLARALVTMADVAASAPHGMTRARWLVQIYDEALELCAKATSTEAQRLDSPFAEIAEAFIEAHASLEVSQASRQYVVAHHDAEERYYALAAAELVARAHLGKGSALLVAGETLDAVSSFAAATLAYAPLHPTESEVEATSTLARSYIGFAAASRRLCHLEIATTLCELAGAAYQRIDHSEGRWCRSDGAVLASLETAAVLEAQGELEQARSAADTAVREAESLVIFEGRQYLARSLALSYETAARLAAALGESAAAATLARQAAEIEERLPRTNPRARVLFEETPLDDFPRWSWPLDTSDDADKFLDLLMGSPAASRDSRESFINLLYRSISFSPDEKTGLLASFNQLGHQKIASLVDILVGEQQKFARYWAHDPGARDEILARFVRDQHAWALLLRGDADQASEVTVGRAVRGDGAFPAWESCPYYWFTLAQIAREGGDEALAREALAWGVAATGDGVGFFAFMASKFTPAEVGEVLWLKAEQRALAQSGRAPRVLIVAAVARTNAGGAAVALGVDFLVEIADRADRGEVDDSLICEQTAVELLDHAEHLAPRCEALLERAIRLDPLRARAHMTLGDLFGSHLKRHAEAEDAYRRAIEVDPTLARAWGRLGRLLAWSLGRYGEAVIALRRAVALDGCTAFDWAALGSVLAGELRCYDEAEHAYRCAVTLSPASIHFRVRLAGLLGDHLSRYAEAVSILQEVIDADAGSKAASNYLGLLQSWFLRDFAAANTAFEAGLRAAPEDPYPAYNLGRMLRGAGQEEVSRRNFERALAGLLDDVRGSAEPSLQNVSFALIVATMLGELPRASEARALAERLVAERTRLDWLAVALVADAILLDAPDRWMRYWPTVVLELNSHHDVFLILNILYDLGCFRAMPPSAARRLTAELLALPAEVHARFRDLPTDDAYLAVHRRFAAGESSGLGDASDWTLLFPGQPRP